MLFSRRISLKRLIIFLRSLSVMLQSGIPLIAAIGLQETGKGSDGYMEHLRKSVERGLTLAAAMDSSPWTFPRLVSSIIRAGEVSGTLQQNLQGITAQLQSMADFRRKITAAMLYPVFVLVALTCMGFAMGLFVLPQLLPLFQSLNVHLPITTQALMFLAAYFRDYGVVTTIGCVGLCIILFLILRMDAVKPLRDRALISIPLIGNIQRNTALAQMCGTLALLLQSGIPIADAIPSCADATGNTLFKRALNVSAESVQGGSTLGAALRQFSGLFPPMTAELIQVGETSGGLVSTLTFLSDFYREETEYATKLFTTALEPIMLITIGIVVGTVILSILLPIYDVTGQAAG